MSYESRFDALERRAAANEAAWMTAHWELGLAVWLSAIAVIGLVALTAVLVVRGML